MSDFNDLIYDAWQVDLEEIIVTKPKYYLVPATLTNEQRRDFFVNMSWDVDGPEGAEDMIDAIGTLIHPIADVENAGYQYDYKRDLGNFGEERWTTLCSVTSPPDSETYKNIIPLVRRTDMEAQVARVAAEKDAEISRLWSALDDIEMGIDALPEDNEDYSKMSAREMRRQALEVVKAEVKALKGGAA